MIKFAAAFSAAPQSTREQCRTHYRDNHSKLVPSVTDFWRHVDSTGHQDPISVNRGVAYLDGRIFRGMPGTRLAALEASTGRKIWDVKVGNIDVAEFVSSAPIAWRSPRQ